MHLSEMSSWASVRDENYVAIAKVNRGLPLNEFDLQALEGLQFHADEFGTLKQFEKVFGKDLSLALFIRRLVGLDRNAAKAEFASYVEGVGFNANQVKFVETLINYLTR